MTFQEATEKFDRANARGEIPNRKDGGTHSVGAGRRDVIVSAARRALHRATDVADVSGVDLAPYAEKLPEHAYRYAKEHALRSPAKYRSRVRLFLLVVEGKTYQRQRSGPSRVLPEWQRLYDALEREMRRRDCRKGYRAALLRLQYVANLRGVDSPEALPDRSTIDGWFEEDGLSDRYRRCAYRAYRMACGELAADELPNIEILTRQSERGLRSLKNLPHLLEAAGFDGDPFSLTGREIAQLIAPKVTEAVQRYLDKRKGTSNAHEKKVWGAASRILAEAIRFGYDPETFDFPTSFLPSVEVEPEDDALFDGLPVDVGTSHVPPLEQIVDAWAAKSWENSPLALDGDDDGEDPAFVYTESIRQDLRIAFKILDKVYGKPIRDADRDYWRDLRGAYYDIKQKIDEHNDGYGLTGHKDKERLLDTITWPQLVCIGLPAVRRRTRRLRGQYFAQYGKHRDLDHRAVHEARTRYHKWLRRYVVTAVVADDGLRIKNYSGAIVGHNISPTVESEQDETGRTYWTAIRRVETTFRGRDRDFVSLKTKDDENNRERTRERYLLPGIVDHELLLDYWRDARPYDLEQSGVIDDESDFDPQQHEDEYALFVSPGSTNDDGRYSPDGLSEIVGKTLHWICREVLGREVPDWNSEERTTTWRALFKAHVTRLMIATYWGGLREEWSYAMRLTDDSRDQLLKSYSKAAGDVMQKKMVLDGWEHPHFFDDVLDRVRAGEEIDWEQLRKTRGLP